MSKSVDEIIQAANVGEQRQWLRSATIKELEEVLRASAVNSE